MHWPPSTQQHGLHAGAAWGPGLTRDLDGFMSEEGPLPPQIEPYTVDFAKYGLEQVGEANTAQDNEQGEGAASPEERRSQQGQENNPGTHHGAPGATGPELQAQAGVDTESAPHARAAPSAGSWRQRGLRGWRRHLAR